ncbi:MAG: hypothetical protein AB2693_33970 [Candidatus Thiodiazotropha sp.]
MSLSKYYESENYIALKLLHKIISVRDYFTHHFKMAAAMTKGKSPFVEMAKQPSNASDLKADGPSGSKEDPKAKAAQTKGSSQVVAKVNERAELPTPPPVSQTSFNKEMMGILQELNTKLTSQAEKVDGQNARIDQLVQRVDSLYSYEGDPQLDYEDQYELEEEPCEAPDNLVHDSEQPAKKTKTDEESVFKSLSDKFQDSESVDCEVDEYLAEFINKSFRSGIKDEKEADDLIKGIHRPSNCSALVKTRVNQGVWRLLKATTQTDDSKMQTIQNAIIKAAACFSKLWDKNGTEFDSRDRDWATNCLALLGHANKLINNRRKEMHKSDLDPKYHYLCSSALPYTEFLYGEDGDVNKNVREINDLNRIGRNTSKNYGQRGALRGRRQYHPYRRGNRGGRGGQSAATYRSAYSQSSGLQSYPKNQKSGHKK